jgi:hypothetical protein
MRLATPCGLTVVLVSSLSPVTSVVGADGRRPGAAALVQGASGRRRRWGQHGLLSIRFTGFNVTSTAHTEAIAAAAAASVVIVAVLTASGRRGGCQLGPVAAAVGALPPGGGRRREAALPFIGSLGEGWRPPTLFGGRATHPLHAVVVVVGFAAVDLRRREKEKGLQKS